MAQYSTLPLAVSHGSKGKLLLGCDAVFRNLHVKGCHVYVPIYENDRRYVNS